MITQRRPLRRGTKNAGVTLLEMLVVVTLVGLLASVVAPSVTAGLETVRLRASAERLAASLRLARERAVRTRHYLEVTVDPQSRRVELRDLEGDYVRDWELPEGITVKAEKPQAFLFAPDGTPPAVRLALENRRGRTAEVEMDPFIAFPRVAQP